MKLQSLINRYGLAGLACSLAGLGAASAIAGIVHYEAGYAPTIYGIAAVALVACALAAFRLDRSRASLARIQQERALTEGALEEKEEEVRAQASRHKTIFEGTPVIMGAIDCELRVVDVSAFCLSELGYARSEVVGRMITDFMAPSAGNRAMAKVLGRSDAEGGVRRNVGLEILRKDGSVMEVLLSTVPERDEDGTIVRHWWVMKDVTERNAMIREIGRREQLYSGVFNQTFQFVALVTPEGVVREANRTLRAYTGRPQAELAGAALWRLPGWSLEPDSADRLESALARAARGDFVQGELRGSGSTSEPTIVDFSLKPLRAATGEVETVIFEGRDVTAQRQQQEELHHGRRMEAMGALTSGIAHDFNNLLTVIAGNLQLIESRAKAYPNLRQRVDNAIGAVFRGQALTRQLLAFSHKQTLQPASIDANELMQSMERLVEMLGEDVRIEFDLADDPWPTWADPAQLETALLNLAINARDAMPDGGRITFATRNVRLEGEAFAGRRGLRPGDYLEIRITDTGHGMSAEVRDHALDPFFTTKPVGQGTGLGLSTAYGFVKQSGGALEISSAPGEGTTIRLYLPRTEEGVIRTDAAVERAPPAAPVHAEEPRILLLEDDADVRETTATFLRRSGYEVEEARDADEAVARLRSDTRYELLFTDIVVPGDEDGYGVARIARETRPDMGILLCSGFPGRDRAPSELAAWRRCEFVEKPYRHDEVLSRVERLLPEPSP